jgi:hypothetical protein
MQQLSKTPTSLAVENVSLSELNSIIEQQQLRQIDEHQIAIQEPKLDTVGKSALI